MEVAVGNASDRYFRVWLVEFGEEEAEFERNIRTSRPQVSSEKLTRVSETGGCGPTPSLGVS